MLPFAAAWTNPAAAQDPADAPVIVEKKTETTTTYQAPPPAAKPGTSVTAQTPEGTTITVTVNDQSVPFANEAGPVMLGGRVMVPLRGVVERLGGNLHLEAATKSITGAHPDTEKQFRLKIGSRNAVANGRQVTLDAPPRVIRGTTYVPLRFISEAMGADIRWDNARRTVVIASAGREAEVKTGAATSAVTTP